MRLPSPIKNPPVAMLPVAVIWPVEVMLPTVLAPSVPTASKLTTLALPYAVVGDTVPPEPPYKLV